MGDGGTDRIAEEMARWFAWPETPYASKVMT